MTEEQSRSRRQPGTASSAAWTLVRVVLGAQSITAGVFSLLGWSATLRFNALALGTASATAASALGSVALILGGACLVTGRWQQLGALAVLAFLIPATVRHLIVSRALGGEGAVVLEVAVRGQLASAAKNLPLIALGIALIMEARARGPATLPEPRKPPSGG